MRLSSRSFLLLLSAAWALFFPPATAAASLVPDQDFQPPFFSASYPASRALLLPDNKFLLYRFTETLNGERTGPVTRHLADGSHDPTFAFSRDYKDVNAAAATADGKYYVAAIRHIYGKRDKEVILRLQGDGAIDETFPPVWVGPGSTSVWSLTVLSDGKLLVAGYFESFAGTGRQCVARLMPDGSIDTSFSPPAFMNAGSLSSGVLALPVVQPDGKVLVAGIFTAVGGEARSGVARLHSDGSLDTSFQPQGYNRPTGFPIRGIGLQADGKVVIGGRFQFGTSFNITYAPLFRLNADGAPDSSFTVVTNQPTTAYVRGLAQQIDGKLVVATQWGVARFHATGAIDTEFQRPTTRNTAFIEENTGVANDVYVQPNSAILVAGNFTVVDAGGNRYPRYAVARLNADGSVDSSFTTPRTTGWEFAPRGFLQLADGSTLLSLDLPGRLFTSPAISANIGRLLPSGSLDAGFMAAPALLAGFVAMGFEQTDDGGVFAWGWKSHYEPFALRLRTDGTADPRFTFDPATPRFLQARAAGNGKMLLAPDMDQQASLEGLLTRLRNNGLRDSGFAIDPAILEAQLERDRLTRLPTKLAAGHRILAVQPDGKILVTYLALDELVHLRRLLPDGAIDPSFTSTTLPPRNLQLSAPQLSDPLTGVTLQLAEGVLTADLQLLDAVVEADGRIVIVGQFSSFAGTAARGVIRLLPNGTVDGSFTTGGGAQWTETVETADFSPVVEAISRQNDGKLLLAGTFEAFDGVPAPGIISLNSDGSVDPAFTPVAVRHKHALMKTRLRRQPDGTQLLAGSYSLPGAAEPTFLRIRNIGGVPIVGSAGMAIAPIGQPFSYNIEASGQPTSYSATGLPAGFAIDSMTGVITGTPSAEQMGEYTVSLTATNNEGTSAAKLLTLKVPPPVELEGAVSRKFHPYVEIPFDLPLPLAGTPGVECRAPQWNAGAHTIMFNFVRPLTSVGSVTLSPNSGQLAQGSGISGQYFYVPLENVPNGRTITVTLHDVVDAGGNHAPQIQLQMSMLFGDVNGNGVVNAADVSQLKSTSGQSVNLTNFRADVNLSGGINSSDIAIVKANAGSSVQAETALDSRASPSR